MSVELVSEAFDFAFKAHRKTTRKGSNIPYITHPLKVAIILMENNMSDEIIAAALLHDVVEDENITYKELENRFGKEVCMLVQSVSEPDSLRKKHPDKKKTWKARKQHTVDTLVKASKDVKILTCADKVANISDMIQDYKLQGDSLWEKFNAPKEDQKWYYESLLNSLASGTDSIKGLLVYQELKEKVEQFFS
jgi:(p)ppGpp synthase/HD superfamily hydrolase